MWQYFEEYAKNNQINLDLHKPGEWYELFQAFLAGAIYGADATMKAVAKSMREMPP